MGACGRKGQTQTPTRAKAPGRSHQPYGGYRGTPSPSHPNQLCGGGGKRARAWALCL